MNGPFVTSTRHGLPLAGSFMPLTVAAIAAMSATALSGSSPGIRRRSMPISQRS